MVNSISLIATSRSINNSSFGSVLLQVWMKCVVIVVDSGIWIVGIYLQVAVGVAEIVIVATPFSVSRLAKMAGLIHPNAF